MDKPKFTIKINGKERSFYEMMGKDEETKEKIVLPGSRNETNDENLTLLDIDEVLAKDEVAAANQEEEEEFEWILPEKPVRDHAYNRESIVNIEDIRKRKTPVISSFSIGSQLKKKKKDTYPLKTLLLSIISALVIGTCFGMVVLRMFTGETIPVSTNVTEQEGKPVANGDDKEQAGNEQGSVVTEKFTVPALDVFLVQGGAFSNQEAAAPIAEEIKNKGFAATTVNLDGKYFLFLGIAYTKETGSSIRTPYDEQGQDTYIKSLSLPEMEVNSNPTVLQARQLFDQLITYTVNKFSSNPETSEWESIKSLAEKLKVVDDESTSTAFIAGVKNAYDITNQYNTTGDQKDFWKTQQALLTSYEYYQKWILEQKN